MLGSLLLLYLVSICQSVQVLISIISFGAFILLIGGVLSTIMLGCEEEEQTKGKSLAKRSAIVLAIVFTLGVFLPNEKIALMMAGTYLLSNTELPAKVLNVLNLKLDELTEELTKE